MDASRCPKDLQSYVFAGDVNADGSDDLVYAGLQHVANTGADRTSFRVSISPDSRSDAFRSLSADVDGNGAAGFVYGTAAPNGVEIRTLLPTAIGSYAQKSQPVAMPGLFNPAVRDWRVMDVGTPGGGGGRLPDVHEVAAAVGIDVRCAPTRDVRGNESGPRQPPDRRSVL